MDSNLLLKTLPKKMPIFAALGYIFPDIKIASSPSEIVKIYIIFTWALSILTAIKNGILLHNTDEKDFEEIGKGVPDVLREDVLRVMNALRPVDAFKRIIDEEREVSSVFTDKTRFWTNRDGERFMYDAITDKHFAVVTYPYRLFIHLTNILHRENALSFNVGIIEEFKGIARKIVRSADDTIDIEGAFATIVVNAHNITRFQKFALFKNDWIVQLVNCNNGLSKEVDNMLVNFHQIFHKDGKMDVAYTLLLDLLCAREDTILGYKKNESGYTNKYAGWCVHACKGKFREERDKKIKHDIDCRETNPH